MRTDPSRRRVARTAAVSSVALLATLLPSTGSSAGEQSARVDAAFLCRTAPEPGEDGSPGPATEVRVGISATFPQAGAPGEPIQPGGLTVRTTLDEAAVAALLGEAPAALESSAALTAEVAQNGERVDAHWTGLSSASAPVPGDGAMKLAHTGAVPPVTVGAPGEVTFTATRLDLTLRTLPGQPEGPAPLPDTGDTGDPDGTGGTGGTGSSGSGGTGQEPRLIQLGCEPGEGQHTRLASVPVPAAADGGPSGRPDGSADDGRGEGESGDGAAPRGDEADGARRDGDAPAITVDPEQRGEAAVCPAEPPVGELDPERFPKPPPGSTEGEIGASLCTVALGYATVRKQDGAMLINDPRNEEVGMMHLNLGQRTVSGTDYLESDSLGDLAFPDSSSAFLAFGFQPVTARVEFQMGPVTIVNLNKAGATTTSIGYYQRLRLYDVRVNGEPLDVGDHCRSAYPMDTALSGTYPFMEGGLLEGEIDIPPFSGCGSGGEDLDPLFTAAVSGPGNVLEIQQGAVLGAGTAPPVPDLPQR